MAVERCGWRGSVRWLSVWLLLPVVMPAFATDADYAQRLQQVRELAKEAPQRAIVGYSRLLSEKPDDLTLLTALAEMAAETGDFGAGARWYRRILEIAPSAQVYRALAGTLRSAGALGEAAETSRRGQQAYPLDKALAIVAARLALDVGDAGYARTVLTDLRNTAAGDVEVWLLSARFAEQAGDTVGAYTACRRGLQLEPGHAELSERLARLQGQALQVDGLLWLAPEAWFIAIDEAMDPTRGLSVTIRKVAPSPLDSLARDLAAWPNLAVLYRAVDQKVEAGRIYAGWLEHGSGNPAKPWAWACVTEGDGLAAVAPRGSWRCAYVVRHAAVGVALMLDGCPDPAACAEESARLHGLFVETAQEN